MPTRGWDAVTVPGAVSAWVALSERFGKPTFADLFEPAIRYAAGYLVSETIARLHGRRQTEGSAGLHASRPGAGGGREIRRLQARRRLLRCFRKVPTARPLASDG